MSTEQGGVRPEAIKIADRLQDYLAAKDPQDVPKLLTDVYALKELGEDKHPLVGKMLFQIGREMEVPVSLGINAACGQIINTPGASRKEMVRGLRRNVQALRMLGLDNSELEHGQETQELINGLVGLFPEIDNPLFGRSNLWRKVGEGVKNIPSAIRSVKREIRKPTAPATVEPAPYLTPGEVLIDADQARWIKIGEGFTGEVSELPALGSVGNKIVIENDSLAATGVVLPKKLEGRQSEDRTGITVLKDGTMVFFGADGVSTGYKSGDFAAQFIIDLVQAEVEATGSTGLDKIFTDPEDFCIKLSNRMRFHHQDAIADLERSRKENPTFIGEHNYNSNKALLDKHGCGTTFFMLAVSPNGAARYLNVGDGLLEHLFKDGSVKEKVTSKEVGPERFKLRNGFSTVLGLFGTYDRKDFQLEEGEMFLFGTDGLVYGGIDEEGKQTLARTKKAFKAGRQIGELGQEGDDLTVFSIYRKPKPAEKPTAPAASRAPETRQPRIISREQFRQRLNNTELTVKGFEAGYSEVESITDEEDPTGDLRAGGLMLLRQRLDHCESKDVFRTVDTLHRKTFSEVTSKMPVPLAREFEGRYAAYWDIKRAKGEPLSEQFGYLRSLVSDASESYKSDYRSAMQEYVDSPEYIVNPDRYYAGRLVVLRERYAEVGVLYITQIAEKDPDALQNWVAGEDLVPGFIDNLGVETEKGKQVALKIYKSTFYILDRAPEGSTGYNNALEWQKALEARLPALAEYGNAIRFTALLTELREAGHLDNIYKSVNGFLERIEQIPDDSTGLKKVQAWAALNQVPRAYDDIDGKRKIFHDFNSIERNIDKLIYHLKLDADTVMGAFGAYQIIEERIRRSGDGTEETQDKLLKDALFVASRGVTLGGIKLNRKEARAFVEAINGYRALNGADEMAALPALPLVDKVKGAVAGILGKAGR